MADGSDKNPVTLRRRKFALQHASGTLLHQVNSSLGLRSSRESRLRAVPGGLPAWGCLAVLGVGMLIEGHESCPSSCACPVPGRLTAGALELRCRTPAQQLQRSASS